VAMLGKHACALWKTSPQIRISGPWRLIRYQGVEDPSSVDPGRTYGTPMPHCDRLAHHVKRLFSPGLLLLCVLFPGARTP